MLVLRRIRMDFDTWDDFGRAGKELVMARRLSDGAHVTGGGERDRPDTTEAEALNTWVTRVGSAAFALPPGCAKGEFLGQRLIGA